MATYSNEVEFEAVAGVATAVELPAPMRGELDRLIVKEIGADDGFDFTVFNRKGACANASDLHTKNGEVSSIADNGSGDCRITTSAAHGLKPGDKIEVKGNSVASHNVTHTVAAVISTTVVDTDIVYGGANTGGRWQTEPEVYPTRDPDMYALFGSQTVAPSAGGYKNFDIDQFYENRDNQSVTARRRAQALWLEITPGGAGTKLFQVSYTVDPAVD